VVAAWELPLTDLHCICADVGEDLQPQGVLVARRNGAPLCVPGGGQPTD